MLLIVLAGCGTDENPLQLKIRPQQILNKTESEVAERLIMKQHSKQMGNIISTTVALTEITDQLELDLSRDSNNV